MDKELIIVNQLIQNEQYARFVIPHTREKFFQDQELREVVRLVTEHFNKYNKIPGFKTLFLQMQDSHDPDEIKQLLGKIVKAKPDQKDTEWLIDATEQHYKTVAAEQVILESVDILQDPKRQRERSAIPIMMQEALAVCFDTELGHDYFDQAEDRWNSYHTDEARLPFAIDILNKVTNGGLVQKSLNVWMASTNVGKSLIMCSLAADWIRMGKNVLYITLEMAEEKIAERIDANLFHYDINKLNEIAKDQFVSRVDRIQQRFKGSLVIKEFPASTTDVHKVRFLLEELRSKRNIKPDVVIVDYINLMSPARAIGKNGNTYIYVKAIAEELRGLSQEFATPIMTATQSQRTVHGASDMGLDNTADSWGLPQTADLQLGVMETDEMAEAGYYLVRQLKNRYADKAKIPTFSLNVEKCYMQVTGSEEDSVIKRESDTYRAAYVNNREKRQQEKDALIGDSPFNFN